MFEKILAFVIARFDAIKLGYFDTRNRHGHEATSVQAKAFKGTTINDLGGGEQDQEKKSQRPSSQKEKNLCPIFSPPPSRPLMVDP